MKTIGKTLADIDAFGNPVTLYFQGKNSFQTRRGGLLSLVIYVFVLWQVGELLIDLIGYRDPSISTYEKSKIPTKAQNFQDMKQQLRISMTEKITEYENMMHDLDPRAGKL